jgi:hypothetical protein
MSHHWRDGKPALPDCDLLFTDVEGSTNLLHQLGGERYAEAGKSVRASLGADAFDEEFERGRVMSLEETAAVAYGAIDPATLSP